METFQFKDVVDEPSQQSPLGEPWVVLIVDDDEEVHNVTRLVLSELVFDNRALEFRSALSGHEALSMLQQDPDIALVLLDVVMETDDAGLKVVKVLRDELHQHMIRIILRTGQPGMAPERKVVLGYDINDYKGKHDLTKDSLITAVVSALRSYKELKYVDGVRCGLQKNLDVLGALYSPDNHNTFLSTVSSETSKLLPFSSGEAISVLVATETAEGFVAVAGMGKFMHVVNGEEDIPQSVVSLIEQCLREKENVFEKSGSVLRIAGRQTDEVFVIYADGYSNPAQWEKQLIDIYCAHLSSAYDNVNLVSDLRELNLSLEAKVTERTQQYREAKLAAEAANHSKSAFLSNMSHEIRTPLNAILGFAQILERDQSLLRAQRETIESIHTAGNHLLELICDVLDLSKIEAGVMTLDEEVFSLKDLIQDVSAMFYARCNQKGLQWVVNNHCKEDSPVSGDKRKLRQILINLVGNAIKFTKSGSVTLQVIGDPDYHYHFDVEDTGVGISDEEKAQLFESFYQGEAGTQEVGTGLGLAISYKQVEFMGGELNVDSELGKGSRFFFSLNLQAAEKNKLEKPTDNIKYGCIKTGTNITALVVDDVLTNRQVLLRMLEDVGVTVITANDGSEALDVIRKESIDIVFMDIRMPIMRGDKAIQIIREEQAEHHLTCIAISAFSMIHEVQQYIDLGFDHFISKPFQFQEVYDSLDNFLDVEWEEEAHGNTSEIMSESAAVVIEPSLFSRFIEAAERNRYTELKAAIDELEKVGGPSIALASNLKGLLRRYDTEAMLAMLKEHSNV